MSNRGAMRGGLGPVGGKLRDELLNGEVFYTLREALISIERWHREYNALWPHSSPG